MRDIRLSFGAIIGAAVIVVICGVAALDWVGQNAASIKAGVGTLLLVVVVLAVTAAAGVLARALWQARRPPAPDGPQAPPPPAQLAPVRSLARQRALRAADEPPAIEPPRVYLNVTPDQLAAILGQVTVPQLPRDDPGQGPA